MFVLKYFDTDLARTIVIDFKFTVNLPFVL